jgi:hypothetical protein
MHSRLTVILSRSYVYDRPAMNSCAASIRAEQSACTAGPAPAHSVYAFDMAPMASRVLVKQDGRWKVAHVHKRPSWHAPLSGPGAE